MRGVSLGGGLAAAAASHQLLRRRHTKKNNPQKNPNSYVAFTDTERLIGDAAKNQATVNPKRTVYDVKRLIGRK